jgi:hypothetical protein
MFFYVENRRDDNINTLSILERQRGRVSERSTLMTVYCKYPILGFKDLNFISFDFIAN